MATVKREQILQEAEKLAARGKLDAAIKEYRRALDQAPNDTNTLNRLGDLLVRVNRIDEAIDVYQQIAEHFAQDGFFLKAIAIFKKVNRLDPQRTQTYERLADLYFKQGLVVEGRQQLTTLADWFLRGRNLTEAVRIFRRLTELEPSNFQARAKLVDLLVQTGEAQAATTEIDALGRFLLTRNMVDEAVKLYHRAIELGPESGDFVAPCIDALLGAGRVQPAIELARKAIEGTKVGWELRRAAARAAAEGGDLDSARAYLDELMPEIGERTDVVQLYGDVMLRVGEAEEAKDYLLPAVDRLLRAGDVARAATLVKRLLRSAPTDIDVLTRAGRVFERLGDHDMVVTIEVGLAEAYVREGKKSEAADLHRRIIRRNPTDPTLVKRLGEMAELLGISAAQRLAAAPSPPTTPPPERPAAPIIRPAPRPSIAPLPAPEDEISVEFIDVDIPPEANFEDTGAAKLDTDVRAAPEPPARPPAPATEPTATAPSPADEMFTEAQVFAKYGLVDKAISHLQRLLALFPEHEQARLLLVSLGADAGAPAPTPPPPLPAELTEAIPEAAIADAAGDVAFEPIWEPVPAQVNLSSEPVAMSGDSPIQPASGAPSHGQVPAMAAEFSEVGDLPFEEVSPPVEQSPVAWVPDQTSPAPPPRTSLPRKPEAASSFSLDDLVGARPTAPAAYRSTSAPPVKLDALEAMLGLSSPAHGATPSRAKAAPIQPDVQLDLGALGLPTTARRRPSVAEQPVSTPASAAPIEPPLPAAEVPGTPPEFARPLALETEPIEFCAPPEVVADVPPEVVTPAPLPPAQVVEPEAARPLFEPEVPALDEVEILEAPIDLLEVEEILAGPSPEQLGELDFFIQQGLLDEAATLLLKLREAFPEHPEVRSRHALLKSRGWDEEKPVSGPEASASELFSEEEQFFDLAAELEKELAEDELVAEATGVGKGGEVSIEELFREFQRGVAEQIQEQDYDTHFNLGLAYREMGLLDEAIGEFQLALKSPELFVESASMIGACYMEKGLPEQAAEWYARGLTAPGLGPESVLGLRYEMGRAQEAAGHIAEALGSFTEVLAVNPGFRDIVDRVSRLRVH